MPGTSDGHLYAPIASVKPADVVMSPDGATLYVAGEDGNVRVYDVATRTLQATWDVGTRLGGIDVSPDGSFLMAVEREPLAMTTGPSQPWDNTTTVTVYRIDTATGQTTSFPHVMTAYFGVFFDVAIGSDGDAILGQSFRNASGSAPLLWRLDPDTGQYTNLTDYYVTEDVMLWRNQDGSRILIGPSNSSNAPLYVYEPGHGFTHANVSYADGVMGSAQATSAISTDANLVVQAAGTLNVYDADLNHQFELSARYPQFRGEGIVGLVFDAAGDNLFVLDQRTDTITQFATADWSLVRTFAIGADVNDAGEAFADGDFGNQLLLSPDGRYFTVVTGSGVMLVENDGLDNDFTGTAAADDLAAGLGNDILAGAGGDDRLDGGAGNDTLIGGTGDDSMTGGAGDDVYLVDSAGDLILENAGGGRDAIYTSVSYTLAAGSEVEILSTASQSATGAINLVGNELGQEIYGNAGANFLLGGGGTDYLVGLGGDDRYLITGAGDHVVEGAGGGRDVVYVQADYTLEANVEIEILSAASQAGTAPLVLVGNGFGQEIYGNAGNNFLQGGGGTDYLVGLGGNDTYFVTQAGDNVVESAGGGTDIIYTPLDYVMIGGVEIELLASSNQAGTNAQTLIGNGFNQTIYGNAGANFLEGGGGTDTLVGLAGNDVYVVDSAGDYVAESAGGGNDVVYAQTSYALAANQEIEVLSTAAQGGTAAIDLGGNNLANALYGNAGANVLNGGAGGDYLAGYGGADTFAFTTALGGGNVDAIADFVSASDKIALDDAIFGAIGANAFVAGTQAQDADDRIVYDSATGNLYFDADGSGAGAQVLFATLDGHPPLNAGDFIMI